MRVYRRGKHISMSELTLDDMGSPWTHVNWDEDKEATFPPAVLRGRNEAPMEIAKALRAKKSLIARLKACAILNNILCGV